MIKLSAFSNKLVRLDKIDIRVEITSDHMQLEMKVHIYR